MTRTPSNHSASNVPARRPSSAALRCIVATFAIVAGAATVAPSSASAFELLGSTTYGHSVARGDQDDFRPILRLEVTGSIFGYFYFGLYGELMGEDGFLSNPGVGGGTVARFRPQFGRFPLVPFLDASVGRVRMPTGNDSHDRVWNFQAGGGIALQFEHWGIEGSVRHAWYRDVGHPDAIPERAIVWSAGINVRL